MQQSTRPATILATLLLLVCNHLPAQQNRPVDTATARKQINVLLDAFNAAAAKADFEGYFNFYAPDAVFAGTDATERWDKKAFMAWAKPYFDKGKAWNFTSLRRDIYFDKTGEVAWFDELLNTQMKICRGSGTLTKLNGQWKIVQYILSATVPNEKMNDVIKLKTAAEDSIITQLTPQRK